MIQRRCSGILLHVTSLPSPLGIGDLGDHARRFADFLADAKQSRWQVLPLGPVSDFFGNSPYSSSSAFAGETLLVSLADLAADELLDHADLGDLPAMNDSRVDYAAVRRLKQPLLDKAVSRADRFRGGCEYQRFAAESAHWLDDFALFCALKAKFNGRGWFDWPPPLRDRNQAAIAQARRELAGEIERVKARQFLFFRQWRALHEYCHTRCIHLVGDVPFYVAHDSADVWAHRHLFKLDDAGRPSVVSGVPPDAFSKTGQLWGNPVYDWPALRKDGYDWWLRRMEHQFGMFDIVRLDHFRGFAASWEVPAGESTAANGRWVEGPGGHFIDAMLRRRSSLPIIAEDLGTITADVRELIRRYDLPGMRTLAVAFEPTMATTPHAPHNHQGNTVVYTGTHDNNTRRGWFEHEAQPADKRRLFAYLGRRVKASQVACELVRLAMSSVADAAISPLQDVLNLPQSAMMNRPATSGGNWAWRFRWSQITPAITRRLARLTETFGRA